MYNNWPARLPTPDLLRHLIQTFFVSHPHASRLLHRPTFMASLDHPPNHPNFPSLSLLHAICALSSIWSPLVEQENMPDLRSRPAEEIFQERERQRLRDERARHGYGPQLGDHRGEWFGEMHARWSREEEEKGAADGVGVFQGLQCEFSLDVRRHLRNSSFISSCAHLIVPPQPLSSLRGIITHTQDGLKSGCILPKPCGTPYRWGSTSPLPMVPCYGVGPCPAFWRHRRTTSRSVSLYCGGLCRRLTIRNFAGGNAPEYILACLLL